VAKSARGFLTNVEVEEGNTFSPTKYCDVLPLAWSYERVLEEIRENPKPPGVILLKDAPDFVDVCAAFANKKAIDLGLSFRPKVYDDLIEVGHTCCFTVMVAAEDASPVTSRLVIVQWNGNWKEIKVLSEREYDAMKRKRAS
jgi:hypothetical protein